MRHPMLQFPEVQAAAARLQGVAHRTPVLRSRTVDGHTGAQVFFKAEHLQRGGAFKFRGAYNTLAQFTPEQRRAGACAFSSGNHAQALALAGQLLGIPTAILMPEDAPAAKLAATRGYQQGQAGSALITFNRFTDDRAALAERLARERGMTLVPPFDHLPVMAGQGTAALELVEDAGPLDTLLVCVGGGGLISGCAVAAQGLHPATRVIGVEPEAGNDVQQSLARGERVTIPVPQTLADGAASTCCGVHTFAVMRERVARVLTVSDAQLVATMAFLAERMKQLVEPTGCLAAAALLHGGLDLRGQRVGVILSGGNVDLAHFARLVGPSLTPPTLPTLPTLATPPAAPGA